MLRALHIENYALIDSLDLLLDKGFTAITGETGAGKSILVGALSLILGVRADSSILFNSSKKCIVEGEFDIHKIVFLQDFFYKNGIDYFRNAILRREISENGSRAFINDTPVTLNVLKELAEKLVDIHSQHHQLLLNRTDFRLQTIDDFALLRETVSHYSQIYYHYKKIEKELQESKEIAAQQLLEKDFLTYQSHELHDAKLLPDEQENLEQNIAVLKNAEVIKMQLFNALKLLSEQEQNCIQYLVDAKNSCRLVARFDQKIEEFETRLNNIAVELKDVVYELAAKKEAIEVDPEKLEFCENRLDTLYRLQQKHSVKNTDDLLCKLNEIDHKLSQFENLTSRIETLQEEYALVTEKLLFVANQLTEKRKDAALLFEKEMANKLALLGMPDAVFRVDVISQPATFSPVGIDAVLFQFSAHSGLPVASVERAASGGELSRIMLAIKSIITEAAFMPTVIFDEIDTGVSGAMASKVAEVMHDVSLQRQLLTITHLPQIAARANVHYLVYKDIENEKVATKLKKLEGMERVTEIAKMMSGNKTGDAAFKAAEELLM